MTEITARIHSLPLQGAAHRLDDSVDLRDLIPDGESITDPLRYSRDLWSFAGYPVVNQGIPSLDFTGIPARWRGTVKDWILLRLNPGLAEDGRSGLDTNAVMAGAAAAERPIKPMSAVAYVLCFAVSLSIIDRNGWTSMSTKHWNAFARALREQLPEASPQTLAGYARPLGNLWAVRDVLRLPQMFGGRPFDGRAVDTVFKVPTRGENVERPAPELCGPVLGLCLWILDHCADDVFARLGRLAAAPDLTGQSKRVQTAAVRKLLEDWERSGRALPAAVMPLTGQASPAWATFFKLAGVDHKVFKSRPTELVRIVERIRRERGLSFDEDGFDLPVKQIIGPDGVSRPWIRGLPATRYGLGLDHWATVLGYASAFVTTIFTTVRDRELAALPHDCLRPGTYERGDLDVPVMRMRGYLVKNRTPTNATWVVGEDVIRAVEVVHRLKELYRLPPALHPQTGEELLFHPYLGGGSVEDRSAHSIQLAGPYLRRFESSAEHLCALGFMPPLPEMPKWLPHRTVRITGIEAYANQAWGDALAAAQGHWSSRKVAEGYYGHLPNSVYIADPESIEEARMIATAQTLIDAAAQIADDPGLVTGAGKDRFEVVLKDADAHELANAPVTARQLKKIAKANPNVYVGEFTVCVHGPGGLCGNEAEADFRLCRPNVCRNSALTQGNRARLELRRRGLDGKPGVFERSRRKIEADAPELQAEFEGRSDSDLRDLALAELPGRYAAAARTKEWE
ncbi:hypothetical protein [Sinomonas atrocyanea]|uniref:hypothetical protein n=1 Tax=Sinomonas atrocyanea TaxID=37927 RepID=UPI0027846E03|nr:hypothetical protein [Sinomonas atrocyanea]MDQ0259480.1 hypothetical protein [Sinomonas atrocyanea]MDR6623525.1 hypothetical protein [Sinomonas atrocyanea]